MKNVILAKTAGFCFGVRRAVDMAYEHCRTGTKVYTYGPIIHNETVVEDLEAKGIKVVHSIEEASCPCRRDDDHSVTRSIQRGD